MSMVGLFTTEATTAKTHPESALGWGPHSVGLWVLADSSGCPAGCPGVNRISNINWATPPVRLGLSGRNSGKIPERPRKRSQSVSWNFPREYGWDAPNPIIQGIRGFQSVSIIVSPRVRLGTPLFPELVPERASQSWSWNSQQYWGYF